MNFEQALSWFKVRVKLSKSDNFKNFGKVAISALEKQIPKKPAYEGDGYDDAGNLIYDTGYCPNCNESYEVDYHTPKYCESCGQALDWSTESEGGVE